METAPNRGRKIKRNVAIGLGVIAFMYGWNEVEIKEGGSCEVTWNPVSIPACAVYTAADKTNDLLDTINRGGYQDNSYRP